MQPGETSPIERHVTAMGWRSDNQYLAVATVDFSVGMWTNARLEVLDLASNTIVFSTVLPNDLAALSIDWLPDLTGFVVGMEAGYVNVYDFPGNNLRLSFNVNVAYESSIKPSLSPDGTLLAILASPNRSFVQDNGIGTLRIVDVSSGTEIASQSFARPVSTFPAWVSWDPTGSRVAALDTSGVLQIWRNDVNGIVLEREANTDMIGPFVGASWSPTGQDLAIYAYGIPFVAVLDVQNGSTIQALQNSSGVRYLSWNRSTNQIAGVSGDGLTRSGLVRIWNADTGVLMQTFTYPETSIEQVAWSAGGALAVASASTITEGSSPAPNIVVANPTLLPTPTPTSTPTLASPTLAALCTSDPATTRNWRITNPNAAELAVTWQLYNSPTQMGTVNIPANGIYDFSTQVEPNNETLRLIVNGQVVAEATGSAEPCGETAGDLQQE